MASRFQLGGAEFAIDADSSPLKKGFAEAYATTQQETNKIAGQVAGMEQKVTQSSSRIGGAIKAGLAIGGAVGLALTAVSGLTEALGNLPNAAKEARTAQQALNRTFGESSEQMTKLAGSLSNQLGQVTSETQKAVAVAGTLTRNYGLTADQVEALSQRTADLASLQGRDLTDAMQRTTSAIRGEAESAEVLGLTLNADAVKATANMTAAQRANFETLDQNTKAQILYNEFMRQSAFATGAAAENAESLDVQLGRITKNATDAGVQLFQAISPVLARVAKGVADELERISSGLRLAGAIAGQVRDALDPAGAEERKSEAQKRQAAETEVNRRQNEIALARDTAKQVGEAAKAKQASELESNAARSESAKKIAQEEKEEIDKNRDAQLKALDEEKRVRTRALEEEAEGVKEFYRDAINAAEQERDARKKAAESTRDNLIRILDEEANARTRTRRQEDRDLDNAVQAERRALEQRQDATNSALEAEQRAIERKRDTALRAIDEERDAEDRRHNEVLDNLDREERARLGELDAQLRAISDQERAERRKETDVRLREGLGDAKSSLRDAQRDGDPRAIERARRDVRRAEEEISREKRNRSREDLRSSIEDQKAAIREEIAGRREAENQKNDAAKTGLDTRAQTIKDESDKQLEALAARTDAVKIAQEEETRLLVEGQKARLEKIQDQRIKEDEVLAERKTAIETAYKVEQDLIKATYDDPTTGVIPALQRQAEAAARSFQDRQRSMEDYYRIEGEKVRQAAIDQARELETQARNVYTTLEAQKNYWTIYHRHVAIELQGIGTDYQALQNYINRNPIIAPKAQQLNTQGGVGTNAYGPSLPGPAVTAAPANNTTLQQFLNSLPAHASGLARIPEPTLLVGARRGPYGWAGENPMVPESITPAGGMGSVTVNLGPIYSNDAEEAARKSAEMVVQALDRVQRVTRPRVSSTLPGAN